MVDLGKLREEYAENGLDRDDLASDPTEQFRLWFDQAVAAELPEPNAMTLGTVSPEGQPWSRTVLLKAYDANGFVFFTNYNSRKAAHIAANPKVSLLLPWIVLQRQVIIMGEAQKISAAESLKYFASRPFGSKVGAWVSQQSSVVSSRQVLKAKFQEIKDKFKGGEIPLPSFWGGYCVRPTCIEFWQGAKSRLHDRFMYSRDGDDWKIERLSP